MITREMLVQLIAPLEAQLAVYKNLLQMIDATANAGSTARVPYYIPPFGAPPPGHVQPHPVTSTPVQPQQVLATPTQGVDLTNTPGVMTERAPIVPYRDEPEGVRVIGDGGAISYEASGTTPGAPTL